MNQGRIVDRGKHDQLIARAGFYRDIYQYQSQSEDRP